MTYTMQCDYFPIVLDPRPEAHRTSTSDRNHLSTALGTSRLLRRYPFQSDWVAATRRSYRLLCSSQNPVENTGQVAAVRNLPSFGEE